MLLQLILALDALAVNAFVMPPNNSTRSIQFQSLVKRTPLPPRDSNFHIPNPGHPRKDAHAFTPHQLQQFKRGHADVMKICLMIIEESEKADRGEKNHFDRAFSRWFALTDEEFVVDVFKEIVDYDFDKKGNPKFDHIKLYSDYTEDKHPGGVCQGGLDNQDGITYAFTLNRVKDDENELILCPIFFQFAGIQKTIEDADRAWGGDRGQDDCDTVHNLMTPLLVTMAHTLVHEYSHYYMFTDGHPTNDHTTSLRELKKIDKWFARENAESYAWFATEMAWSVMCDREFIDINGDFR